MTRSATSLVSPAAFCLAAGIAATLNVVAQLIELGSFPNGDPLRHVFDAAIGIAFVIAALLARPRAADRRIAWLLLVGGISWSFSTMAYGLLGSNSWWVPFRAFEGAGSLVIVALAVSYPTGRLAYRLGGIAIGIALILLVADILAHLFLYDPGAPLVANPVALVSNPDVNRLVALVSAGRDLATAIGLAVIVVFRWLRGSRTWQPINVLMTSAVLLLCVTEVAPDLAILTGTPLPELAPRFVQNAATGAIPIIYVVGLYALGQTRMQVADVIVAAREGLDRTTWDRLVQEAFYDPRARVFWAGDVPGGFVDASGASVTPPPNAVPVMSGSATVALLVHDPATGVKPELVASLAESIRLMTANDRLSVELERTLAQVRESRQRIVGAADDARRRIERDLHDGAQQLLLTAALSVENASRRAGGRADDELTRMLRTATEQLDMARKELRELARGITPAVLNHGGLDAALEELALRCPIPVTITVDGDARPAASAETTVYFTVSECLANVAKHSGATKVSIDAVLGDSIHLTITDDGIGGASITPLGGLAGLVDRIEAVGGDFTVSSPIGRGTVARAIIPSFDREPA